MDGLQRVGGYRRSRRSRSQRDRERKMSTAGARDPRPYSPSSGSDLGRAEDPGSSRPRRPRRRKRDSTSCEEDIIDGFAIASFVSLETLEKEAAQKPPERVEGEQKSPDKRKSEEGRHCLPGEGQRRAECSDPDPPHHNGDPDRRKAPPPKKVKTKGQSRGNESSGSENGSSDHSSSRGPWSDESVYSSLGTGYFCDIDSDADDKPVCNDNTPCPKLEVSSVQSHNLPTMWKSNLLSAGDDGLSKLFSTATMIAPRLPGSPTPRSEAKVSGLERSRELNMELDKDPPPQAPPFVSGTLPRPQTQHIEGQTHLSSAQRPSQGLPQPCPALPHPLAQPQHQAQPRIQPFARGHGPLTLGGSRSNTPSKLLAPASQLPHRASTPSSLSLALSSLPAAHGFTSTLPSSPHPHHPGVFAPSPGLPPPPPLTSAMLQVAGHPSPAAANFSEQELIRQELNSRYLSSQGPERNAALGTPSFQFHQHQHSHQHTHQHTHQHFSPFPPMAQGGLVPSSTTPMYLQTYPSPACSVPPSVLPPAGPFSSLQGAFQPKTPNAELVSRSGSVHHALLRKEPRLMDSYRSPQRKPGKWCAMHVWITWMIYRHQEKNKMLQLDHPKLDLTNSELLSRTSGIFSTVAPAHELARPVTLFTDTGAVHPATSPFVPPKTLSTFLNTPPHLDPYTRSPTYSSNGQLSNSAFGGLGSTFAASPVFAPKECPGAPVYWNRLHQTPPSFPTPPSPWPREKERSGSVEDPDKQEVLFLKEEKESDMTYGRQPARAAGEERDIHVSRREKCRGEEEGTKREVTVKEEGERQRSAPPPGGTGPFHALHPLLVSTGSSQPAPHPPPAPAEPVTLLDRGRVVTGPFLRVGRHPVFPWDPWGGAGALQHCYPARTGRERHPPLQEPPPHFLPTDDFEQRARLLAGGFLGPVVHPHHHHHPYLSPTLFHPSPPYPSKNPALSTPPPLISGSRPSSKPSAAELRDFEAYTRKNCDTR